MVNPGHPSFGCYACRRKKMKCDQTRPHCLRCIRLRKVCPGYRDSGDVLFRNFTALASEAPNSILTTREAYPSPSASSKYNGSAFFCTTGKSPAHSLVRSSTDPPSHDTLTSNIRPGLWITPLSGAPHYSMKVVESHISTAWDRYLSLVRSKSEPRGIPQALELPLTARSLALFFYEYPLLLRGTHVEGGWQPDLPLLYAGCPETSCLKLAVDATATANAGRRSNDPLLLDRARRLYGKTLVATRHAVLDPTLVSEDATLTAMILLTLFEYISDDTNIGFGSHQVGYEQILELREARQVRTPYSMFLFQEIEWQILSKHMRFRTSPSPSMCALIESSTSHSRTSSLSLALLGVTKFSAAAADSLTRHVSSDHAGQADAVLKLVQDGSQLDDDLQHWSDATGPIWHLDKITDFSRSEGIDTRPHVYRDILIANRWSTYRGARVILHLAILECAHRYRALLGPSNLSPHNRPEYAHCAKSKAIIESMLNDIVASIPFMLGAIDSPSHPNHSGMGKALGGLFLIWPLGVLLRCPLASREQKRTASHALDHIGFGMGIHRALTLKGLWTSSLEIEST